MFATRALQHAAALLERVASGACAQTVLSASGAGASGAAHQGAPAFRAWQHSAAWRPAQASGWRSMATAAPAAADGSLSINPSAVARLKELQAESPDAPLYLRVEVEGGGCSGFQYKFRLDNQLMPEDIVLERDGSKVVSDSVSLEFLKGATLDFEDTLMRAAFTITSNPNAEASCGCGSSFAAKVK